MKNKNQIRKDVVVVNINININNVCVGCELTVTWALVMVYSKVLN